METRPRRANANIHPGQIVIQSKQKRRTAAEKAAAVKEKADRKADAALKAQENRSAVVARIAQLEDSLQKDDRSYGNNISGKGAASKATYREAEHDTIANPSLSEPNSEGEEQGGDIPTPDSDSEAQGPKDGAIVDSDESEEDTSDDSDKYESDTESDASDEDRDTDVDEDDEEVINLDDIEEKKVKKKGKGRRATDGKDKKKKLRKAPAAKHRLRDEVTQARKMPSLSSQKRKAETEPIDNDDDNEDEPGHRTVRRSQKKAKKQIEVASGLQSDWRKLVKVTGSKSATSLSKSTTVPIEPKNKFIRVPNTDTADDTLNVSSDLSRSRPSSRASAWTNTPSNSLSEGVGDVQTPGAFDDDEGPSSLQAARAAKLMRTPAKPNNVSAPRPTASRTTHMMGLSVKKVDVNGAAGLARDPIIKSEQRNTVTLAKPYRHLKVSAIPITGDYELTQWDLLVRGVLDWAGTLSDPFGTNEHPDLLNVVQALWDKCLPERNEDVSGNLAIKKVVNDRLNEWRSAFGKKAVQLLNDHIKANSTLRNDTDNIADFVGILLPSPRGRPVEFPLIYSDPKGRKGSWLAPLLIQVFAMHLRRVVKAPQTFGFPAGALALSTAALERALTLFETGADIRDNKTSAGGGHAFDNKPWGGITLQYAGSTCDLPERKWGQIMEAASVYIGDRGGGPSKVTEDFSDMPSGGRTRIAVSDEEVDS